MALYALARRETSRLAKSRTTKIFLLLAFLVPVATALAFGFLQTGLGMAGGMGPSLPLLMLGLFTSAALPLFLFLAAAHSFAGDEAVRTTVPSSTRTIAGAQAYAAKVAAITAMLALLLVELWTASVLSGWLIAEGGLAEVPADSLKAYAAAFVPLLAIGLVATALAQGFRRGSSAVAAMIVVYAAARLLTLVVPQLAAWSVYSYTNWPLIWIGDGISSGKLINTFAVLLSYCIMAYTAGWLLFERNQT